MKTILIIILVVLMISIFIYIRKRRQWKWYHPKDSTPIEQCPCCDYISLPERGNYLICPICFWEDDGLDINESDKGSGPNSGISLREARKNFDEFGTCEKLMVNSTISIKAREKYELIIRELSSE